MQQLLQLEFSLPFLNVRNANTLANNLRISFNFASNLALLPALPPSSTNLHGLQSSRITQQLPGDSFFLTACLPTVTVAYFLWGGSISCYWPHPTLSCGKK